MAIKFYSDKLKRAYDSEAEALAAEAELEEKIAAKKAAEEAKVAARKEDAKKVEQAWEERKEAKSMYEEASKHYTDVLAEFNKKYGPYHFTVSDKDVDEFIDSIFREFKFL